MWKFGTSLLCDAEYTTVIAKFWHDWRSEKSFPLLILWWDAGKTCINSLSRSFYRQSAQQRRSHLQSWCNMLLHFQCCLDNGEDVSHFIAEVKHDLELELEQQYLVDGIHIRPRKEWAEEGKHSAAYFLRSERTKGSRKLFTGIKNATGLVVRSLKASSACSCINAVYI